MYHFGILRFVVVLVLVVYSIVLSATSDDIPVTVSPAVYKQLQRIDALLEKSAYSKALQNLNTLLPETAEKSYAQAVIMRSMAAVYLRQGKFKKAAGALEKSLATGALPLDQKAQAQVNLGELYVAGGQYKKAIALLQAGIDRAKSPTSEQYFTLANSYAQLKQYKKAIPYMNKAVKLAKKPKESWYKLLLAMHYESDDYSGAVPVLKKMIARFPTNKDYWFQLIGLHQQLNDYKKALAVNELAYREGFVSTPADILNLANMMLLQNTPYRAAELIEKEINTGRLQNSSKNWEQSANAWTDAREYDKAVAALKKAAALHPSGEYFYRLGRLFIEQGKWKNARAALLKAFEKGGLKDPGNAQILFGVSCYELHLTQKAVRAFNKAQNYKNTRKIGRQWLEFINSES